MLPYRRLLLFAGMSTLGETIDAWALPPDTAQRVKDWLTSPAGGWKLEDPPDDALLTLNEEDLKDGGFNVLRERRIVLAKLKPHPGEHPVQVHREGLLQIDFATQPASLMARLCNLVVCRCPLPGYLHSQKQIAKSAGTTTTAS